MLYHCLLKLICCKLAAVFFGSLLSPQTLSHRTCKVNFITKFRKYCNFQVERAIFTWDLSFFLQKKKAPPQIPKPEKEHVSKCLHTLGV